MKTTLTEEECNTTLYFENVYTDGKSNYWNVASGDYGLVFGQSIDHRCPPGAVGVIEFDAEIPMETIITAHESNEYPKGWLGD